MRACSLSCRQLPSHYVLTWPFLGMCSQRQRGGSYISSSSYKGMTIIIGVPWWWHFNLIASQRPHLQIPSHKGWDFNIGVLKKTQTLMHNSRCLISNFWIRKSEWFIMLEEDFGYPVLSWPVITRRKAEHAPTQFLFSSMQCSVTVASDSSVTPWTAARQVPLSVGFPRQEYWSGLPVPSPGDLPNPGTEHASLGSPALAGRFFTTAPPGKTSYL